MTGTSSVPNLAERAAIVVVGEVDDDHLRLLGQQPERAGRAALVFVHLDVRQRLVRLERDQYGFERFEFGLFLFTIGARLLNAFAEPLDPAGDDLHVGQGEIFFKAGDVGHGVAAGVGRHDQHQAARLANDGQVGRHCLRGYG